MLARLAYLNNYCLPLKVPFVTSISSGESFHPIFFFLTWEFQGKNSAINEFKSANHIWKSKNSECLQRFWEKIFDKENVVVLESLQYERRT